MSELFDSNAIANRGWRQGAVMGSVIGTALASKHAPELVDMNSTDWLILTSHDCDIVNPNIEKEPFVEVLRANVALGQQEGQTAVLVWQKPADPAVCDPKEWKASFAVMCCL